MRRAFEWCVHQVRVGVALHGKNGILLDPGPHINCTQSAVNNGVNQHFFGYTDVATSGVYYAYAFVTIHYYGGSSSTVSSTSPVETL